MTLLSSTADDFDVETLLNTQHSDTYNKILPNNNNDNNNNNSYNNMSKISLTNDNNDVVPSSLSQNGTKGREIILIYLRKVFYFDLDLYLYLFSILFLYSV